MRKLPVEKSYITIKRMNLIDPYKAGKCPICGEYAMSTFRHPGAPVRCKNEHLWFRDTNLLAVSPTDTIEGHTK